jgi:hypothetical protein
MHREESQSPRVVDCVQFVCDGFQRRTIADMEVALDKACRELPHGNHAERTAIARRIIEIVQAGACIQDAMTRAAMSAVNELESNLSGLAAR